MPVSKTIRPIAIYLPQFHPIPENDAWWGKGFTEWTNVVKAKPLFEKHYQPHLPADLGFYDLRLQEVREAQADLAKQYGIYGFCYYHYWFNGRRVLERPMNEILKLSRPDFPFCLCWANENWTRRWDGYDKDVLLKQEYNFADDKQHIHYLCKIFQDKRYIRIDGKPLFIIYRSELFPDIRKTTQIWREEALKLGIGDIYLARMESFTSEDPTELGFDAAIEFQPDWRNFPPKKKATLLERVKYKLLDIDNPYHINRIFEYREFIDSMLNKLKPTYKRFPCVVPSWDNSARRQKQAAILDNSTPQLYEEWLTAIVNQFIPYSSDENLLFINAWNEWAEGNHLEPCQKWGRAYLEATLRAVSYA